ncbi:hypothetical protein PGT21_024892 [Puccinia graminis f. sp. tritici]|uniref:Uncharacterized protein n=1 Tax=Puccinia graminis f. sp. tritici TaxID=56615 RepID=A0A5B0MV97_PUCGR|nr:hypothetical protein PGT21_024892 [Puccinia graminis f. sp. tritici]
MVFVLPMCSNLRGQPQVPAPGFFRWGALLEDVEVLMQQLRKPVMKSPRMIFISGLNNKLSSSHLCYSLHPTRRLNSA